MKYYECHGHIAMGREATEEKIQTLKNASVIYYRDGGDAQGLGFELKQKLIDEGIDFVSPIFAIYKEGLYGKYLGRPYENMKDFSDLVKELKQKGADYAKLVFSGIASFKNIGKLTCPGVPKDEIFEMVRICHDEGLAVMVHCNGADTIKYAIESGVDSLEHGIFIDDEGLSMLSKSQTIWVPTITAITNDKIQKNHIDSVSRAASLGIKLATGSDSGAGGEKQCAFTKKEYDILISCGFSEDKIQNTTEELRNRFRRK